MAEPNAGLGGAAQLPLNATNGTLAGLNGTRGNATAYEDSDPEEIQHAVLAFYLVLVSVGGAGRPQGAREGLGRRQPAAPPATAAPPPPQPPRRLPAVQFVMFFAQAALVSWRKRHKRSYDLATLVGLWLIPPIISFQLGASLLGAASHRLQLRACVSEGIVWQVLPTSRHRRRLLWDQRLQLCSGRWCLAGTSPLAHTAGA